jgi:hypothetical protein
MAKDIRKIGFAVVLSFAIGLWASAQTRGGFGARGTGGLAHASSGASRGFAAPGRTIAGSAPGISRPGLFTHPIVGPPLNPNFAPIRGVPGLGFDRQHLAANEHPFLNRFGRGRGLFPFYPYFAPLFLDTLPLDYDAYSGNEDPNGYDNGDPASSSAVPDYYTQGAQQPQFMIPQPGATAPAESAPSDALATQAPPPELGQLILVRRDGKVLLAVAFTVRNGNLTYVTTDGARRSFPLNELDKEATRQMNDANGTSVSLPD